MQAKRLCFITNHWYREPDLNRHALMGIRF